MNEHPQRVVCDAGPLIHLDELDCLSLLDDFDAILLPAQVWKEVERHRPGALAKADVSLQKVDVVLSSQPAFQALVSSLSLDLGEQAALSLMQENPESILLTDDAAARLAAMTLGYRVHGTVGILVRAIRRKQRTREEILSILRRIPTHSTLYIRSALLEEIISQVERSQMGIQE